jgi:hypothetical protein
MTLLIVVCAIGAVRIDVRGDVNALCQRVEGSDRAFWGGHVFVLWWGRR